MNQDINKDVAFLKHLLGVANFFSWVSQWESLGYYKQDNSKKTLFNFNSMMSKRFTLGYPKAKKYGKNPFIAFQTEEYSWANNIVWAKACLCLKERRLYIISQKIETIYGDFIPSFGFSIEFLYEDMLKPLLKCKEFSLKSLWFEDENDDITKTMEFKNPILSTVSDDIVIPFFVLEDSENIISDGDMRSVNTGNSSYLNRLIELQRNKNKKVEFIKGNHSYPLSDVEKEIIKKGIIEVDYSKPKIRIRVD